MASTALQVVVSPFLGVVFDKLSSLIQSEFVLIWGVEKELKKLSRTLCVIKYVLTDAEEKQVTDATTRDWLKELKDAAYDADDVLDECAAYDADDVALKLASEMTDNNLVNKVADSLDQMSFSNKIGEDIKELRERFDEIAKERPDLHLQRGILEKRVEIYPGRETGSLLTELQVYGRIEDEEYLVRLLLTNANSREALSVCPILGVGGLGKTTLAQQVYNHASVEGHFEVRSWVCVTNDFDVKRLTKATIASLSGDACALEELDPLQRHLQEELRGKRFLLVLDDVWEENQDEWNKLKGPLRYGAEGSSVIVTTRLETVASISGTIPPYRLNALTEDDCFSLFKQHAFGLGNEERPALVDIGKEIVKKCGGLPLAAKALGSLMRFKSEPNEWLFVRDSGIWELPQNNILPALRLSYNHLAPHLKQCFAYCSIFPKGCKIEKEKLIQLWIANDLVKPHARMELEDSGNEIFSALLWRSFFQDIKKDKDGNVETCKMHGLVHDLACDIAGDECSIMNVVSGEHITKRTRHISLLSSDLHPSSVTKSIQRFSPSLRSLIWLEYSKLTAENSLSIFTNLIRLRALDLHSSGIKVVPDFIGEMIHLRYLNLSNTGIVSLPESICFLNNVQTLKLRSCYKLQTLPRDMRKMSSLRHLDTCGCDMLTRMASGMGQLTCLQTLSFFIVSLTSGCSIKELAGLNLGGELEIRRLENVEHSTDAKGALVRKKNLRSLCLSWTSYVPPLANATEVIEDLCPHSNLRRLFIKGYEGVAFPSWLAVSLLPNLIEIHLSECKKHEHHPLLGKLPLLKVLTMESMDSVKFIDHEDDNDRVVKGFQSLEELRLISMPNLEGWSLFQGSETTQLLPCLKRLILQNCPKLQRFPFPSSVQSVKVVNCTEMVLRSLQNLPCLSSLHIGRFDNLVRFPEEMLQNLISLQELNINSCPNLKILPVELKSLSRLTRLSIWICKELVALPEELRNLHSLKYVDIRNCPALKGLSELVTSSVQGGFSAPTHPTRTSNTGWHGELAELDMFLRGRARETRASRSYQ